MFSYMPSSGVLYVIFQGAGGVNSWPARARFFYRNVPVTPPPLLRLWPSYKLGNFQEIALLYFQPFRLQT